MARFRDTSTRGDDGEESVREAAATYRPRDDESPTEAVVAAVGDASDGDVGPGSGPPLYDVVDPDALDRLFRPATRAGRVVFDYAGWVVVVHADGRVVVGEATPES